MRQAGILAAAGLVSLRDQVERLSDDHANARRLAERIGGIEGLAVDLALVQTNIVIFEVTREGLLAPEVVERWGAGGVLALALNDRAIRAVTHYDVDRLQIDRACAALAAVMSGTE